MVISSEYKAKLLDFEKFAFLAILGPVEATLDLPNTVVTFRVSKPVKRTKTLSDSSSFLPSNVSDNHCGKVVVEYQQHCCTVCDGVPTQNKRCMLGQSGFAERDGRPTTGRASTGEETEATDESRVYSLLQSAPTVLNYRLRYEPFLSA